MVQEALQETIQEAVQEALAGGVQGYLTCKKTHPLGPYLRSLLGVLGAVGVFLWTTCPMYEAWHARSCLSSHVTTPLPAGQSSGRHPGGNPGANLKSISHRCQPLLVASE